MARLLAGAVDVFILAALAALPEGLGLASGWALWLATAAGLAAVIYLPLEATIGRTPGKAMASLRVVQEGRRQVGWGSALVRWALRWGPVALTAALALPLWVPIAVWVVLLLPSGWDATGRALHDLVAGTVVVDAHDASLRKRGMRASGVGIFNAWGAGSILGSRQGSEADG
ncbi:RDD family protein [Euzebya tangerina]|uniref:RDD family protein n=1 Tax=Euzebya tangerina TaxID=591198 RepID=UPI0013C2EA47|nr:RDD family protein [Euzebya tangerina]